MLKDLYNWFKDIFSDPKMYANVFFNVAAASVFIAYFFFTYASGIEQEIVKKQTRYITNDLITPINPIISNDLRKKIISKLKVPDLQKEDQAALDANNLLKSTGYFTLFFVYVFLMSLAFLICCIYGIDYYHIIMVNLILLVCIGLTEFTFLHFLPEHFVQADTNWVKWKILSKLREKLIY